MNTEFRSSFLRDVRKIVDKDILFSVEQAILNVENAVSIKEIADLKKLTGYKIIIE